MPTREGSKIMTEAKLNRRIAVVINHEGERLLEHKKISDFSGVTVKMFTIHCHEHKKKSVLKSYVFVYKISEFYYL